MRSQILTSALVGGGVLVIDQVTKELSSSWGFSQTINAGISFGLVSNLPDWILFLLLSTVVGILSFFSFRETSVHPVWKGLFFGGAVSNLVDRIMWGGVKDWLPIPFTGLNNNIADWALAVAVIGYVVSELFILIGKRNNESQA